MTYALIVSQGRVADRTDAALVGARLTGEALAGHLGVRPELVGRPSAAAVDDWTVSLPEAGPTLTSLRAAVDAALDRGDVPLLVTNTCAASLATLPAAAARHPDLCVLWIDAHGDFHTPATTASGYLGGMVLAAACGRWESGHGAGVRPEQVVLVGARDLDPPERALLEAAGVRILPPGRSGPADVRELVGDRPLWIHVDWDVLEPGHVPAEYRVPGGLRPHDLAALFAAIPAGRVRGVELAEFAAGDPDVPDAVSLARIVATFRTLAAGAEA